MWVLDKVSSVGGGQYGSGLLVPSWTRGLKHAGGLLCAVCSHDCDIENVGSRTGLQIAPVMAVPASPAKEAERHQAIVASGISRNEEYDYIQFYPIELPSGVGSGGWAVVDFSAINSLAPAAKARELLESSKVATMTAAEARSFREKLAAQVGRPYQDPRPS